MTSETTKYEEYNWRLVEDIDGELFIIHIHAHPGEGWDNNPNVCPKCSEPPPETIRSIWRLIYLNTDMFVTWSDKQ